MAIMPHCVVCGFYSGSPVAGDVTFADYDPGWQDPVSRDGSPVIGWSNSLGVTAPEGVGLFCSEHLEAARKLRRLPAKEAVARLAAVRDRPSGRFARLRSFFG